MGEKGVKRIIDKQAACVRNQGMQIGRIMMIKVLTRGTISTETQALCCIETAVSGHPSCLWPKAQL